MARRLYEEDSFTEDFEEAPLQRTWRLRGGHEEACRRDRPDVRVDSDDPATSAASARKAVLAKFNFRESLEKLQTNKVYVGDPEAAGTSFKTAQAVAAQMFAAKLGPTVARGPPGARAPVAVARAPVAVAHAIPPATPAAESVEEPSVDEPAAKPCDPYDSDDDDWFPPDLNARRVSTNESLVVSQVKFLPLLCGNKHNFQSPKLLELKSRVKKCKACNQGLLQSKKQCTTCKLYVHPKCEANCPLPCIEPTPMPPIGEFHLHDCTANTSGNYARVPAILTKLFHEIQKVERIDEPNLYLPLAEQEKDMRKIENLILKLNRNPIRHLLDVPTNILTACVLRFLMSVRCNLIHPETEKELLAKRNHRLQKLAKFTNVAKEVETLKMNAEMEKQLGLAEFHWNTTVHHTIAALALHLNTVMAHRLQNAMTEEAVLKVFRPVFPVIDFILLPDPEYWLRVLRTFRED